MHSHAYTRCARSRSVGVERALRTIRLRQQGNITLSGSEWKLFSNASSLAQVNIYVCMHVWCNMYTWMRTYTCTDMYSCVHTCIHTYILAFHTYVHTYIHADIHTYSLAHMYVCIQSCMCMHYINGYMQASMRTCIYAYMH